MWDLMFFVNSVLFGVSLAMDAFSVSIANGLGNKSMSKGKMLLIPTVFALFQALMPMLGWVCVHYLVELFGELQKFVPFVALALLLLIGTKMIVDNVKGKEEECSHSLHFTALIVQAIATSIDALSVGLTFSNYDWLSALVSSLIIAVVTFGICFIGVFVGRKFGAKFKWSGILGGVILILIGIEIFLTGILG